MLLSNTDIFALENFEGPLEFLLSLIHKEEITIYDVPIQTLIQQFILKLSNWQEYQVDKGAEFIGMAAYLIWLKSKMLLPKHTETSITSEEEEEDPNFEIIHHLLDYCRFKQVAKELSQRQEQQTACFFRGASSHPDWKKPLGIHHLSLDELSALFKEMMGRASAPKPQIYEENWKVADKIKAIRLLLENHSFFSFEDLFHAQQTRLECIVTFLAVLELMKLGEIEVGRKEEISTIFIFAKQETH